MTTSTVLLQRFATYRVGTVVAAFTLLAESTACSALAPDCHDTATCTAPSNARADGSGGSGGSVNAGGGSATATHAPSETGGRSQSTQASGGNPSLDGEAPDGEARGDGNAGSTNASGGTSANAGTAANDGGGTEPSAPDRDGGGTEPSAPDAGPPACASGTADCNGNPADACETTLTDDPNDCGGCGVVCSATGTTARACVDGVCKPTCAANFADCSTPVHPVKDDGCEADLRSTTSCGACGHDCLGGACSGEQCQPVTVAAVASEDGIAFGGDYINYVNSKGAPAWSSLSGDRSGAAASAVADGATVVPAAGGSWIYWGVSVSKEASIANSSPGKSNTSTFVSPASPVIAITADSKNVYWSTAGSTSSTFVVHQASPANPTDLVISPELDGASGLVSDGAHVFVAATSSLVSLTVGAAGGSPVLTAQSADVVVTSLRIAVDASRVYYWTAVSGAPALGSLPKTFSGAAKTLVPLPNGAFTQIEAPIAVAGGYVYFSQIDGLYRVSTNGGVPKLL
ncbi:MAG TPA: hypothetical protein VH142_24835, partial [Polyangiaceae bacterium]|nr:hypothetical protein [Polyangiaceae bacterium]